MEANDIPPVLTAAGSAPEPEPNSPSKARWRWWVHLIVLAMFPLLPLLLSLLPQKRTGSDLPSGVPDLLIFLVYQLGLFAVFFLVAWLASRVTPAQLMLRWRGGVMPIVWGFLYSVGIRLVQIMVAVIAYLCWVGIQLVLSGHAEKITVPAQHMVDKDALVDGSLYLLVSTTLLSFILGGLREELWRAAMFAGVKEVFPRQFESMRGKVVAVLVIAVLFGLGHVSQGWTGAILIGLVGAILGAIMLWRRSIWEAVIAHGFFDATSFLVMYLIAKYPPEFLQHQ